MTNNSTLAPVIGALPSMTLAFLVLLGSACSDTSEASPDEDTQREQGVDTHDDEEGEEDREEVVMLTEIQIKAAGIVLQTAGPGTVDRHITLPVVVTENGDTLTHVNPKSPGIVRSIGNAETRITEDPVRMLRAVHFARRLDYQLDPELEAAIANNAALLDNRNRRAP